MYYVCRYILYLWMVLCIYTCVCTHTYTHIELGCMLLNKLNTQQAYTPAHTWPHKDMQLQCLSTKGKHNPDEWITSTNTHTHSVLYTITVQQQYTIFNHSNMWGYAIHWSLLCILVLSMPTVSSLCVLCSTVLWSCVHVLGLSRCLLAGCTCNHRHLVFVKCTGWGGVANWFVLLV